MDKEVKYVSVCPNCGSTDINTDFSNPALVRFGAPLNKVCNSCGYQAVTFPEIIESKIDEYRKSMKDK